MAQSRTAVNSVLRSSSSRVASQASSHHVRYLATPASSKSTFRSRLDEGPSLDDFIADNVPDRVVLGNTSQ